MKERNIDKIDISKSRVKPTKKYTKKKINIGFDTETEKGKCFLLAYNDGNNSDILNSDNPDIILNYLTRRKFFNTNNFFYNLTYDFQAISKTLPIENIKELAKRDKTFYKEYIIKYIPNKMFCITKKDKIQYNKFYDLAQYYNMMKLDTVGDKYFNFPKVDLKELGIDIANLSNKRYNNDSRYRFILNKYLIRDCEITQKAADYIISLAKPFLTPKYFYSQASFSQQYYLENTTDVMNLPSKKILQYALNSFQGGRFEVMKRGFFPKANIYDIKSAYPYHNAQVPNTNKGIWKLEKEYDNDALISIFKCDIDIYDIDISPLKYQLKNNLLIYPIGKFKDVYINKKEYELIDRLGYKIKVHDVFNYYDYDPSYPYEFLKKFFYLKERLKKEGKTEMSWLPKIIINGFYGKMIQIVDTPFYSTKELKDEDLQDVIIYNNKKIYEYRHYKAGMLFNPIVANEITSNTRVQLFNSVFKNLNDVIGFQTDSIITEKRLNIDFGDKLGQWEKEKENQEMIMVGSGVYQILGENPKIKVRGFQKNIDIYEIIKNNPLESKHQLNIIRNNKLKSSMKMKINPDDNTIMTDKDRYDKFNLIEEHKKDFNINFDKKRLWDRKFKDFNDVLNSQIDSKPIII